MFPTKIVLHVLFPLLCITFSTSKQTSCDNEYLSVLGCSCDSTGGKESPLCQDGLHNLNCLIDSASSYDLIISQLQKMYLHCWSDVYIENVELVTYRSFAGIQFFASKSTQIITLHFKNLLEVETLAFDGIKLHTNDRLCIILDSLIVKTPRINPTIILHAGCFSNVDGNQLAFVNFINSPFSLHTSTLTNSTFKTLLIQSSWFAGFFIDSNDAFEVSEFLLDRCSIDLAASNSLIVNRKSLKRVEVKSSDLRSVQLNAFTELFLNLIVLNLDDNIITRIEAQMFAGLVQLQQLSLRNNPLAVIDNGAFASFHDTLIYLDLSLTSLTSFALVFVNMSTLLQLDLSNTRLNMSSLDIVLNNAPRLVYLNLANSNILRGFDNVNALLDHIELHICEFSLKFIDASSNGMFLDDDSFVKAKKKQSDLWQKVLASTFVKVNENHVCSCALLYLYRNASKFILPDILIPIHSKKRDRLPILIFTPKCYRVLWRNTTHLAQLEAKCEFDTPVIITTSTKTTHTQQSTHASRHTTTTAYEKIIIHSKFTLIIGLSIFVLSVIAILAVTIKARFEYKKNKRLFSNYSNNLQLQMTRQIFRTSESAGFAPPPLPSMANVND